MRHAQRGFSIIAVVFLLVVLGGLGAVIAQLATTQHLGTLMAQEGRQAWYAARAGLEWGRHRALAGLGCNGTLDDASGFESFAIAVTCTSTDMQEGSARYRVFAVSSVASRGGTPAPVERVATMTVWQEIAP